MGVAPVLAALPDLVRHVVLLRSGEQVSGVAAEAVVAGMQGLRPVREMADGKFVGHSIAPGHPARSVDQAADADVAIATDGSASPRPAGVRAAGAIDFLPEAISERAAPVAAPVVDR